jgi:FOG: WD40 repeat
VTPGEGTQDTRRRALRTELGAARWRTVRHVADARFLVTGQDANGQEYAEVAHEALIQSWPTLREWMQADRSFRRWQERMRLLARQWQESKMDEGALLRGALLLEAQEWLVQRGDEIEAKLQEFISASETHVRAEQERQKRLQRRITLGLVIGLLMFALLFVFALIQRNAAVQEASMRATAQAEAEAQRNAAVQEASIRATAQAEAEAQRTLAQVRQMAAVGQLEFDRLPQGLLIGTILGIEALQRVGPLLEADQLVRRGLDLLPAAVARMTHGRVSAVAFSPDGQYVVSGSYDGTAWVWEAATGRKVARMTHGDGVSAVAFSPDGQYVVSGGCDKRGENYRCIEGTARVWEAASGREVARLTHDDWVFDVAFSPDGRYVVSGSEDNTARVWEAASGREVARLTHDDWVFDVAFSPDGRYVVSGSWDGTARVWWWRPEDLIAEACRRLPRNLTREEWQRYVGPEVPYHATCPGKP